MISGKVIWLIAVLFAIFKGGCCSNTNQTTIKEVVTIQNTTYLAKTSSNDSIASINDTIKTTIGVATTPIKFPTVDKSKSINVTNHNQLEIVEIFHENLNVTTATPIVNYNISVNNTIITNCLNISSVNNTCIEQSWNDTIKTNYTTVAEAVGVSEDLSPFRLQNTAAIAAGVFLVSAVLGYISCVGYRRFLQRKYGNSQILVGEETYDTTDLKYFEI